MPNTSGFDQQSGMSSKFAFDSSFINAVTRPAFLDDKESKDGVLVEKKFLGGDSFQVDGHKTFSQIQDEITERDLFKESGLKSTNDDTIDLDKTVKKDSSDSVSNLVNDTTKQELFINVMQLILKNFSQQKSMPKDFVQQVKDHLTQKPQPFKLGENTGFHFKFKQFGTLEIKIIDQQNILYVTLIANKLLKDQFTTPVINELMADLKTKLELDVDPVITIEESSFHEQMMDQQEQQEQNSNRYDQEDKSEEDS